jgi:prepilin-type N-terminal cleavage/methylation domain-containing protein
MRTRGIEKKRIAGERPRGFSLIELLIALVILLSVAGIVMSGITEMSLRQASISNRTEMHSSVRSATEVLQQEIGQAGRIALPTTGASAGPTMMTTAVALGADPNVAVTAVVALDSVAGVYPGMLLVVDTGDSEETVSVTSIAGSTITGKFSLAHPLNVSTNSVPVRIDGVYSSGIVPTTMTCGGVACGSDGFHLKLYGDINDDGKMVYIEYFCDRNGIPATLKRSVTPIAAATPNNYEVILPNLAPNPADAACFTYDELQKGGNSYDVDVSVTLTVQAQYVDLQTHVVQKETKALLNVSPRNIFEGYQLAGGGVADRIQPMPATVATLLSQVPY